ncbi:MAG: hypothetical protein F4X91_09760 [Nitrospinae bacterium]|nr:hypothetical protein [Nitrospinota bacterium]
MARVGGIVRSLPYPIIEEGNLSYPNGEYQVETTPQQDGVSVLLNHTVKGAAFLERLVSERKAKYGCLVSVPLTGYRKLHLSDEASQRVEWDMGVVGEPPMLRPVVVSVTETSCMLGPEDEVAEAWQGREIAIPKGARLALQSYLRPTSSLHHLLHVVQEPNFRDGCFEVKPCEEEGFYFKVHAASDLFPFLQNSGGHAKHRGSVLTHVVCRCLEILARDYSEPDEDGGDNSKWEAFPNLRSLASELEKNELPIWEEDGFSADKVATQLYPHNPPNSEDEE